MLPPPRGTMLGSPRGSAPARETVKGYPPAHVKPQAKSCEWDQWRTLECQGRIQIAAAWQQQRCQPLHNKHSTNMQACNTPYCPNKQQHRLLWLGIGIQLRCVCVAVQGFTFETRDHPVGHANAAAARDRLSASSYGELLDDDWEQAPRGWEFNCASTVHTRGWPDQRACHGVNSVSGAGQVQLLFDRRAVNSWQTRDRRTPALLQTGPTSVSA